MHAIHLRGNSSFTRVPHDTCICMGQFASSNQAAGQSRLSTRLLHSTTKHMLSCITAFTDARPLMISFPAASARPLEHHIDGSLLSLAYSLFRSTLAPLSLHTRSSLAPLSLTHSAACTHLPQVLYSIPGADITDAPTAGGTLVLNLIFIFGLLVRAPCCAFWCTRDTHDASIANGDWPVAIVCHVCTMSSVHA